MFKFKLTIAVHILLVSLISSVSLWSQNYLYDFKSNKTLPKIISKNCETKIKNNGLNIKIEPNQKANIIFQGNWDLSAWLYLTLGLKNQTKDSIRFDVFLKGKVKDYQSKNELWNIGWLKPNEDLDFNCVLLPDYSTRKSVYKKQHDVFPNMRGFPEGVSFARSFDLRFTNTIELIIESYDKTVELDLKYIDQRRIAVPEILTTNSKLFFPFIDKYGQYIHADWNGKIHSDKDFKSQLKTEIKILKSEKKSEEWNVYGGFKNGPKYKATGHFRIQKINDKWWIIDPSGCLFWSTGVNAAGVLEIDTPIKNRTHFFSNLFPENNTKYAKFYKNDNYLFGRIVRQLKYGTTEQELYTNHTIRRLENWGINTMGSWSDVPTNYSKKMPYTIYVGTAWPILTKKLPDVFDPRWEKNLNKKILNKSIKAKDDPYCFGFFIDNELYWNTPNLMANAIIALSSNVVGKQKYISLLKTKLKSIQEFNTLINTNFSSWNALLENTEPLNLSNLEQMNITYYEMFCHKYFATVKASLKKHAPNKLYLGCRWFRPEKHKHKYNVGVGAKYIDILTFNQYDTELINYAYPLKQEIDKPFMITEFNFGALDTGKFYPGLNFASDQRNRGEKYVNFIKSALLDNKCVGAHWFMYANSTSAGRSVVGENANCGLVSETDTPYYELINRMKLITHKLYKYRWHEN